MVVVRGLHLIPFRWWAPYLGQLQHETGHTVAADDLPTVDAVSYAVHRARLPWQPTCLEQAVAAQWMLRRYRIASTLYLGVRKHETLEAHAWVRCGPRILTGGSVAHQYHVIASFAND